MGKLDGKVALITGGSSGMALATAERFIAEGAFVHITGRGREALEAAVSRLGPQANGIVADSSDMDDIERLFAGIDRLDILFASAGASDHRPLLDVAPADFDRVFDVNVRGTLFTAQKAASRMTSGGAIILNGSVAAVMAEPGSSVYAASKAALVAFARVWSVELAALGIRVNVLHPGPARDDRQARRPDRLRPHRRAPGDRRRRAFPGRQRLRHRHRAVRQQRH